MNNRIRIVLATGTSLVVVAAAGGLWATSSLAATSRYQIAAVATGDVAQTYLATGAITRENVVASGFTDSGTVSQVKVAVGDQVAKGDVLATLDTTALKLQLLNAETDLANAKSTLYAAQHPSVRSSGSGGSGTSSKAAAQVPTGITATDATTLYRAIAAVNVAVAKWTSADQSTSCDVIYRAVTNANPSPEPTTAPSTPTKSDPTAEATPTPSATATGSPTNPSPSIEPSATVEPTAEPTPTPAAEAATPAASATPAEQLALVIADLSNATVKACGQARVELTDANNVLAGYYQQLITTGTIRTADSKQAGSGKKSSTKASASKSSTASLGSKQTSSSASTSARAVASAEADVLRAQQSVDSAESALDHASLLAPLAGTVGTVSLTAGASSSSGTVTIVGSGLATVTIEAPLATRKLLSEGMKATVTPAGSTTTLTGSVSSIATIETSGTAGDTPTYTTKIAVEDPDGLLNEGAKAGVSLITATASGLTVPASAVTPTGAGTGTVKVVDSPSATTANTVDVKTGAVGGGRVQITDGLTEGQLVVLSDETVAVDTLTTNTSGRTGFGPR